MNKAEQINRLAALIREVDGNHDLGAGVLAEKLVERLDEVVGDQRCGSCGSFHIVAMEDYW